MDAQPAARRLSELAEHVGGVVVGDASLLIRGVGGLSEAGPGELSFYGDRRYAAQLKGTRASAVLVHRGSAPERDGPALAWVQVDTPHLAYARISTLFHPAPVHPAGVSDRAWVDPTAHVDPSATVMAFVTVARGARVGPRAVLHPGVYVGEQAEIGAQSLLYSNVTVRERCWIGARVILHAGVVVGADGFGFAFDPHALAHVKIPQAGNVRIEDDVEVGANTCIDRATTGETVIGAGTKIDNLVQVAHNVRVGPLSILCAQAGVSGSAELGAGVLLAGQAGVVGHLKVGDQARIGPQSGVAREVAAGETVSGSPAMPHAVWLRAVAALRQLPGLVREVRELKQRLAAVEQRPAMKETKEG